MKLIFIFALFLNLIFAEEPSVFEMQSSVTKKEIEELKKINTQQSDKIFALENRIKQLEISLEGLMSIYNGYGNNIKEINDKISAISSQSPDESQRERDLNKLKEEVTNNTNNIQVLKESIDSYVKQIQEVVASEINHKDTQTSENPNTIKDILDNNSTAVIKDTTNIVDGKEEPLFEEDITRRSEIFKEARTLTYSKKFDEAIARYKWFITIDYKKAESNYMLGNIAYEQNRYKDAVYYYKESAVLDDKAKYMPRLLLNSANSFRVLNDKENAQKFYRALSNLFPNSAEAKEAKKYITN